MACIFISYRREDSSGYAGRIYDRFCEHFGNGSVFMDVDTIQPGDDFVEVINQKVGSCEVFVAVVGKQWVSALDQNGRRRLDNPNDFVRLELSAALARKIRVIPVLVGGAHMPAASELPESLATFSTRNAIELTDTAFQEILPRLIHAIETTVQPSNPVPVTLSARPPDSKVEPAPRKLPVWLYGIGALAIAVIAFLLLRGGGDSRKTQQLQLTAPERMPVGHRVPILANSSAGLPVVLSVKGSCIMRGSAVLSAKPGVCQVIASQAGDQEFQPVSIQKEIQVVESPDACREGFIWREVNPNDHVCVTPETRRQVRTDNSQHAARVSPTDHSSGPDTCVAGYVWREAVPNDHVCVTLATREQAAADNHEARNRLAH